MVSSRQEFGGRFLWKDFVMDDESESLDSFGLRLRSSLGRVGATTIASGDLALRGEAARAQRAAEHHGPEEDTKFC